MDTMTRARRVKVLIKELDAVRCELFKLSLAGEVEISKAWHHEVVNVLASLQARAQNMEAVMVERNNGGK